MSTKTDTRAKGFSILLSAYACEPGLGSEPAVGWEWATNLALAGCNVHVLTRSKNKTRIESAMDAAQIPNLTFTYFDLPFWLRFWKRGNRGVHLYYVLWQMGAFLEARHLVRKKAFDLVHHVTFVTARFPSFMGLLGLPFVFGPLAGGEYAPRPLWRLLGREAVFKEFLRAASMMWWRFSPLLNVSFWSAKKILVTSDQTYQRLPKHARGKSEVMIGIGGEAGSFPYPVRNAPHKTFRILFVGRFLYWKGMEYGLEAVARLCKERKDLCLTMIGDGPCKDSWQRKAQSLGIADRVEWRAGMPREEFLDELANYDVLLFPSLHDSGGMVVIEAMTAGLPVVCLNFGGPAVLVDKSCGFVVDAGNPEMAVAGLAAALRTLINDWPLGVALGQAGQQRARTHFSWTGRAQKMVRIYRDVVEK